MILARYPCNPQALAASDCGALSFLLVAVRTSMHSTGMWNHRQYIKKRAKNPCRVLHNKNRVHMFSSVLVATK